MSTRIKKIPHESVFVTVPYTPSPSLHTWYLMMDLKITSFFFLVGGVTQQFHWIQAGHQFLEIAICRVFSFFHKMPHFSLPPFLSLALFLSL